MQRVQWQRLNLPNVMNMDRPDESQWWHHPSLKISGLYAFRSQRAFPRHSHDYSVIALVDHGAHTFLFKGARYYTPVDGLILLNPDEAHTCEPAVETGFEYRTLYPTDAHMAQVAREVGAYGAQRPYFTTPRADDLPLARRIRSLISLLRRGDSSLASESALLTTLVLLMKRYGGLRWNERGGNGEHSAVRKAREYIDGHFDQGVTLTDVAEHVHFSRYYLLRAFRQATGMPPHQYLDSVRVRHAQKLLGRGEPLADVALQSGFGSQSHFTQRFKQIIGVTPGVYARELQAGRGAYAP